MKVAEHGSGIGKLTQPERTNRQRSVRGLEGTDGSGRSGGYRRMMHHPEDDRLHHSGLATSNLDPDCSRATISVGKAQHRQPTGEPIPAVCGDAGRDSLCLREGALQQDGAWQRRTIGVAGSDGAGKPRQVAI